MLVCYENIGVVGVGRIRVSWSASASFFAGFFNNILKVLCYRIAVRECGFPRAGPQCACLLGMLSGPTASSPPVLPCMAAVTCGWPRDRDESVAIAVHALCACVRSMRHGDPEPTGKVPLPVRGAYL